MAELTQEQKDNALLKARVDELEAIKEQLESEKAALKEVAESGTKVLPVAGTFKAKVRKEGKTEEQKFGFKDGYQFVRNDKAIIFPTEEVIKVANGGEVSEKDTEMYPSLVALTKEAAQTILQNLVDLGFAGLKNQ
jgi:hypothetical protein